MIPLTRPYFTVREKEIVNNILDSGWLTGGKYTKIFEDQAKEIMGYKYACAVNSCTSALFLSINALALEQRSEIIVPSNTFIATVNSICLNGHIPIFCDIDKNGMMDLKSAEKVLSEKTMGIIPVQYAGQLFDIDKLMDFCCFHDLEMIMDSAHSFGSPQYGLWGSECFSFHNTKNFSTGEGGMIMTNQKWLYNAVRCSRQHGLEIEKNGIIKNYILQWPGYNMRMTELQAGLGLTQIDKLKTIKEKRYSIYKKYKEAFGDLIPLSEEQGMNYHIIPLLVSEDKRDEIRKQLWKLGIQTNIHYKPCHTYDFYNNSLHIRTDLSRSEEWGKREITIPFYTDMEDTDIDYVIERVLEVII